MAGPMPGKALVLQSGGPTRVINRSIQGVMYECAEHITGGYAAGRKPLIDAVYGGLCGVKGILDEDFIDLTSGDANNFRAAGNTPASALGTTRYELVEKDKASGMVVVKRADVDKGIDVLRAHNIRYIFTIGGGDSSETAQVLSDGARERDYELCIMHVPKTIDNDLVLTDHCPGYPSAATFVINYLIGTWFDARSMGKTIDLNVVMGRNAGWLTASAAWCRRRGYRPFIVTPEKPMEIEEFVEAVKVAYAENDKVLQIAVSEGARGRNGEWAKQLADEAGLQARKDVTGRAILSDIPLANLLAPRLKDATGARVVADTLGYAQRSFLGTFSDTDAEEAEEVGREAVWLALNGRKGKMVSIQRCAGTEYAVHYEPVELSDVAKPGKKVIRRMEAGFFDERGQPNNAFADWLDPLLGEIPETAVLEGRRVEKIVIG